MDDVSVAGILKYLRSIKCRVPKELPFNTHVIDVRTGVTVLYEDGAAAVSWILPSGHCKRIQMTAHRATIRDAILTALYEAEHGEAPAPKAVRLPGPTHPIKESIKGLSQKDKQRLFKWMQKHMLTP